MIPSGTSHAFSPGAAGAAWMSFVKNARRERKRVENNSNHLKV
jgi:hypothetical protein